MVSVEIMYEVVASEYGFYPVDTEEIAWNDHALFNHNRNEIGGSRKVFLYT